MGKEMVDPPGFEPNREPLNEPPKSFRPFRRRTTIAIIIAMQKGDIMKTVQMTLDVDRKLRQKKGRVSTWTRPF